MKKILVLALFLFFGIGFVNAQLPVRPVTVTNSDFHPFTFNVALCSTSMCSPMQTIPSGNTATFSTYPLPFTFIHVTGTINDGGSVFNVSYDIPLDPFGTIFGSYPDSYGSSWLLTIDQTGSNSFNIIECTPPIGTGG